MPTPKDMPPHKPENPKVLSAKDSKDAPLKRPFVRKPHLTQRPFKNNPGLELIRKNARNVNIRNK
jgi:hypothetical protein